jgi:hypothetical protein
MAAITQAESTQEAVKRLLACAPPATEEQIALVTRLFGVTR